MSEKGEEKVDSGCIGGSAMKRRSRWFGTWFTRSCCGWCVGAHPGDRRAHEQQWQMGLASFWLLDRNLDIVFQNVGFWMGFLGLQWCFVLCGKNWVLVFLATVLDGFRTKRAGDLRGKERCWNDCRQKLKEGQNSLRWCTVRCKTKALWRGL